MRVSLTTLVMVSVLLLVSMATADLSQSYQLPIDDDKTDSELSSSATLVRQLTSAIERLEDKTDSMKFVLQSILSRASGSFPVGSEFDVAKRVKISAQQGRRYDSYGVAGRFGKRSVV